MIRYILAALMLFMLLMPSEHVTAQWRIPRSVMACGGLVMTSNSYTINSSVGQTITGSVSAGLNRAQFGFWHTFSSIAVGVDFPGGVANGWGLEVFPNPFRQSTTIRFTLKEASTVLLETYDVLGRKLSTLANEFFDAGSHDISFDVSEWTSPGTARLFYMVMKTPAHVRVLPMAVLVRPE